MASEVKSKLRHLLSVGLAINDAREIDAILVSVVTAVREMVSVDDASIVLWNAEDESFEQGASTNMGEQVSRRVRRRGGASRWIIDHLEPLVVNTHQDPFNSNIMIPESGILSYAGVPLYHGDTPLGVLYALSKDDRTLSADDVELLESVAAMATSALRNARMVASLEQVNELRTIFMRLAAHDLREPLTAVIGFTELLKLDLEPLSETHASWLNDLETSADRMLNLINGMLGLERVNYAALHLSSFEVTEMVGEVVEEASRTLPEGVALDYRHETSCASKLYGDVLLLREAVTNLVSNALRYAPEDSSVEVTLGCDRQHHVITVADKGPGIREDLRTTIFDPFVRGSTHPRGSGLGLSLVKAIVERHDGHVEMETETGQGTTFRLFIPLNG